MRALSGVWKGGMQSRENFVRNSVKEIKFHKMYQISQNFSLESQKSPNLTHGT